MQERLCPKCGAYWQCDCVIEVVAPPLLVAPSAPDSPYDDGCAHDWAEAVGVEVIDPTVDETKVFVCRLCGLYRVESGTPKDASAYES